MRVNLQRYLRKLSTPEITQHPNKRFFSPLFNLLKIVIAIVLIGVIFSRVKLSEFIALWRVVSIPWLAMSLLFFYAGIGVLAQRYRLLIGTKISYRDVVDLVITQTVAGNLVATSAGMSLYLGMLRGKHQLPVTNGLASLMLVRLADTWAVLTAVILSSWFVWPQMIRLRFVSIVSALVLAVSLLTMVILFIFRLHFVQIIERCFQQFHLLRYATIRQVIHAMIGMVSYDPYRLCSSIGVGACYTGLAFALSLLFFYSSIRAFHIPLEIWPVMFIFSLIQLINVIPIQILGGIGINDVTLMYLSGFFGITQSVIAPAVIGMRSVFYLSNLSLLIYIVLVVRFESRPK